MNYLTEKRKKEFCIAFEQIVKELSAYEDPSGKLQLTIAECKYASGLLSDYKCVQVEKTEKSSK